jgi:hypothetical protein
MHSDGSLGGDLRALAHLLGWSSMGWIAVFRDGFQAGQADRVREELQQLEGELEEEPDPMPQPSSNGRLPPPQQPEPRQKRKYTRRIPASPPPQIGGPQQ